MGDVLSLLPRDEFLDVCQPLLRSGGKPERVSERSLALLHLGFSGLCSASLLAEEAAIGVERLAVPFPLFFVLPAAVI
jgi:hypothetical protein